MKDVFKPIKTIDAIAEKALTPGNAVKAFEIGVTTLTLATAIGFVKGAHRIWRDHREVMNRQAEQAAILETENEAFETSPEQQ